MMLLGLLAAVGCGNDGFSPSAPSGKALNELTPDQAKTLCLEAETFSQSFLSPAAKVEYMCRVAGLEASTLAGSNPTDADIQAFCKVGYDACKRNPPVIEPDPTPAEICADATPATCAATVGQLTACVNERTADYERLLVPCNRLTKAKVLEIATADDGPACRTFQSLCPSQAASALTTTMTSALEAMKR
jgi:hypothetical protein